MPAVAITDHGNLYGALSFYDKMRNAGVKPIIGIEAYIARGSRHDRGEASLRRRKGKQSSRPAGKGLDGYRNLVKLSSLAYLEGFWRKPGLTRNSCRSTERG